MVNVLHVLSSLSIENNASLATSTVNDTLNTAKAVQEYGIMTVICAAFIVISITLFVNAINTKKQLEVLTKLLQALANDITAMKTSNVDIAGSFDRHNTAFILGSEETKRKMTTLIEKIQNLVNDDIDDIKERTEAIDRDCSDVRDGIVKINDTQRSMKEDLEHIRRTVDAIERDK